jgi:hypothetical protein
MKQQFGRDMAAKLPLVRSAKACLATFVEAIQSDSIAPVPPQEIFRVGRTSKAAAISISEFQKFT